jgi:voltage-gated potassium channel
MNKKSGNRKTLSWQEKLYEVIFEADTPAGKAFDILLILSIIASIVVVKLVSKTTIRETHGPVLNVLEWFFTALFTAEYFLRIVCAPSAKKYTLSFFGIVDLLAVLPTYLSLLVPGTRYLVVIRTLRVLRIFRVLKLVKFMGEAEVLMKALAASRRKITVFLFTLLTLMVVLGSLMYIIEGGEHGFTSIPRSIYWAIVTLTTVGYGDISPQTNLGQILASIIMILGYSIIAVPTGIVTVEYSRASRESGIVRECPRCRTRKHDTDAIYCKQCGSKLSRRQA